MSTVGKKLYSERMALASERHYGMQVRIARFQNCYGAQGTWQGDARRRRLLICRKVAEVADGGQSKSGRWLCGPSYTHVQGHGRRHYVLMQSDLHGAVNIGCPQYVTVSELVGDCGKLRARRDQDECVKGPWACNRGISATPDLFHRLATRGST